MDNKLKMLGYKLEKTEVGSRRDYQESLPKSADYAGELIRLMRTFR